MATGCYPGGADYVEDLDIVITDYDDSFDFSGKNTYALVDSISHVGGENSALDRAFDQEILNQIDANMMDRGYTKYEVGVTHQDSMPDFLMRASAVTFSNDVVYCDYYPGYSWGYWGGWGYWYPGYGYPGYGWGYPYCGVGYSFDVGTILIEMVDLNNPNTQDSTFTVVWIAGLNGIESGRTSLDQSRIKNGVDDAFDQSTYLRP